MSTELTGQRGAFGDTARGLRSALLYREIEFDSPFAGVLIYSGWWFRQKIEINGETVWFRISWMQIFRHAAFTIPPAAIPPPANSSPRVDGLPSGGTVPDQATSPAQATSPTAAIGDTSSVIGEVPPVRAAKPRVPGRIEIDFTRGLTIRRFRFWIADELIYDEIN